MARTEILTDDQAVKGSAFPVEVKVYEGGIQVIPSSATITVKDPDGTAVVSAAAMPVSVGGTMTYSVTASILDDLWEDAVLEVSYVVSTVTYKAVFFFDCALNALRPNVVDDDLKRYAPQLADERWSTQTTYDAQIQEAFRIVKRAIKDKGRRPAMLIDGAQVRELVILKTLELISFDFAKSPDDIWWNRYQKYEAIYKDRLAGLVVKYDEDESGTIEDNEKKVTFAQPTFYR
jgi:hypothetical protein